MPKTRIVFFMDENGRVPVLEWLDTLPEKALDKCVVKLERLSELGHELRRPEADYLRDGIYELRVRLRSINYRLLYFFHGQTVAVAAHALVKESTIPSGEIEKALARKRNFLRAPQKHTFSRKNL